MAEDSDRTPTDEAAGQRPDPSRVLARLPTAVIVVDEGGVVTFANDAAVELIGWERSRVLGANVLHVLHPDDQQLLVEAFVQLAERDVQGLEPDDRSWAPVNFRFVRDDGIAVPVEVIGRGALRDPDVGGLIYEVRPAHDRDILQRVLAGVASGGGLINQFELVLDLVSTGILDMDSAVLFSASTVHEGLRGDEPRLEVVRASSEELFQALDQAAQTGELGVFAGDAPSPEFVDLTTLGGPLGRDLAALGLVDAWYIDVAEQVGGIRYRIVGFTNVHHVPAVGVMDRLARAAELASVIVLRVRSQQLLERAAHSDALTGLPNRLGLQRDVAVRQGDDRRLCLLFVDLDRFKPVNDEHGHHVGDEVLSVVARRLVASTAADDLVARIGGDEFAVVISSDGGADADRIARRLIDAIADPIPVGGEQHSLSASIGLVDVDPTVDLDTALGAADRAMYEAKRAGGGRTHRGRIDPFR